MARHRIKRLLKKTDIMSWIGLTLDAFQREWICDKSKHIHRQEILFYGLNRVI